MGHNIEDQPGMKELAPALERFLNSDEYTKSRFAYLLGTSMPVISQQDPEAGYYSLAYSSPIRRTTEQLDVTLTRSGHWLESREIIKKASGMVICYLGYRRNDLPVGIKAICIPDSDTYRDFYHKLFPEHKHKRWIEMNFGVSASLQIEAPCSSALGGLFMVDCPTYYNTAFIRFGTDDTYEISLPDLLVNKELLAVNQPVLMRQVALGERMQFSQDCEGIVEPDGDRPSLVFSVADSRYRKKRTIFVPQPYMVNYDYIFHVFTQEQSRDWLNFVEQSGFTFTIQSLPQSFEK